MAEYKQKLEVTALIAEVIAAIGVIFSVIYLSIQIGGNTAALRTQAHHNLLTQANQPILIELGDRELGEIIAAGLKAPSLLSDYDWRRFTLYQIMAVNSWEYGYYLNRDGSAPAELWVGVNDYYVDLAETSPGMKKYWEEYAFIYAEPFRSYADKYFSLPLPQIETE